jgi:hypothetical protein
MPEKSSKTSPFWRDSPLVDEGEIFSSLVETKGTSLFLGRYSMNEVIAALGKKNFLKEASKRRLWPLAFDLDSSQYPLQRLRIFFREKRPESLIVDLKIREGTFVPKERPLSGFPQSPLSFLILEWLTLQNPSQEFTSQRPALPGQVHPGLTLGKKVLDIFAYLARLTHKDGVLAFPAYFHNALLFSRYFYFINPEKQAEVCALRKSFPRVSLKHLAWAVHFNCVRQDGHKTYEWKAEEQVYPLRKNLKDYFDSKPYRRRVKNGLKKLAFSIDWEAFAQKAGELFVPPR